MRSCCKSRRVHRDAGTSKPTRLNVKGSPTAAPIPSSTSTSSWRANGCCWPSTLEAGEIRHPRDRTVERGIRSRELMQVWHVADNDQDPRVLARHGRGAWRRSRRRPGGGLVPDRRQFWDAVAATTRSSSAWPLGPGAPASALRTRTIRATGPMQTGRRALDRAGRQVHAVSVARSACSASKERRPLRNAGSRARHVGAGWWATCNRMASRDAPR